MKMRPSVLNTFLVACCSMSLVLNSAGKLLMLQEPEEDILNRVDGIRYTCISEDDQRALVWNNDLKYYDQKQHEPEESRSIRARNMAKCALVESENCIAYWKASDDWSIVNSRDHPTGPVFDSRWEDFAETSFRHAYHDRENYQYVMQMTKSGNVVFSVRGSQIIDIRICEKNRTEDSWCLTITFGTVWDKTRIHTNYCMFTDFGTTNKQPCINTDQTAQSEEIFFNKQLWRTLIFKWNVGNIKVCNKFGCLFEILLHQDSTLQDKYFFMNMDDEGLMRFHFYDYLLITKKDTALESDKFYHNGQNLCFEFIAGLCDGCYLEIHVVDVKGESERLTSIYQTRSSAIDEKLTWQRVELNKTLKHNHVGHLSFEVITRLNESKFQPQWAIHTLRKCKLPDAERKLTLKTVVSKIPSEAQQDYRCQKMSYNTEESFVVNSYLTTSFKNISASMQEYLRKTSYSQAPCPSNWWKRTLICDQSGCVCIEKPSNSIATASPNNEENRHVTIFTEPSKLEGMIMRITSQGNEVYILSLIFPKAIIEGTKTYQLTIELNSTRLRTGRSQIFRPRSQNYTHDPHLMEYNHTLYLLASSEYLFSVHVVYYSGYKRTYRTIYETPDSLGFGENAKLELNQTETSIELKLPTIVNDTLDSEFVIVVKGSSTCTSKKLSNELRKRINMTETEKEWITSNFFVDPPRSKVTIPIEQRPAAKDTLNDCSLRPGETYVIVVGVVVKEDYASDFIASLPIEITVKKNTENSVSGWIISFFILAICFLLLFIWRREILGVRKRICRQDSTMDEQILVNSVESTITHTFGESVGPMEATADDALSMIDHVYEEIISNRSSSLKSLKDFENYVKESTGSRFLQYQFQMFQKGLVRPCAYGLLPENRPKNRYPNIIPYDDTRVILKRISGDPYSDYINANYVQGYHKKNAYIATQNPIYRTMKDFWRMIWEKDAAIICMLADVMDDQKTKFVRYWPQLGASGQYGNIVVVTEHQQLFADYTLRTFRLSCGKESRNVDHLYYTGWPSHSMPVYTYSVISCLGKLLAMPIGEGPIIIHSDAGVGRTGAFILCDICLRRAIATGKIDVVAELRKLRDCRPNMVQNELQYVFAHIVLVEWLLTPPTKQPCDNDLPRRVKLLKKQLPEHIQRLRDSEWQNQALRFDLMTTKPPKPKHNEENRDPGKTLVHRNGSKVVNRFDYDVTCEASTQLRVSGPDLGYFVIDVEVWNIPARVSLKVRDQLGLPASTNLAYSPQYLTYNDNKDPINAVIVDGLRVKNQYLTCQLPHPSTLRDFWRLVAEQEVRHIIVLQQPNPNDPKCCRIITDENPFSPVPFMNVEINKTSKNNEDCFVIDDLILTEKLEGITSRSRQISILTCTEWGIGEGGKPPPPKNLVDFWIASQNILRKEGPTLVLCHNGVTGCGLYLALSFILERMAVERECDIILAVRAIRRSRPDFVQSQEQFEYLYDAAAEYIKSFKTYANFT